MGNDRMDSQGLSSITLRTGGAVSAASRIVPPDSVPSSPSEFPSFFSNPFPLTPLSI